jgi:RNA polymerase sigma-70 factor (ECF subfamily)
MTENLFVAERTGLETLAETGGFESGQVQNVPLGGIQMRKLSLLAGLVGTEVDYLFECEERAGRRLVKGRHLSDEACFARMRVGDPEPLGTLFVRYHRLVFAICIRILRDEAEAEDVMQAVFIELLRSADRFDSRKGSARSWIVQYAYHRSFNRKKYLALRGHYLSLDKQADKQSEPFDVMARMTAEECRMTLRKAMETLSEEQRSTIEKVFFGGYRLREAAEELGVSPENARHYYYRGLDKLRRFFAKAAVM